MKEIFQLFLGENLTIVYFFVYLVWAYMGFFINLIIDINRRKPESETSPKPFSLNYWWNDNKWRLLSSFLLIPVAIILSKELMGMEISNTLAFLIGLGSDTLIELIKRKKAQQKLLKTVE